jgi:hypothetical protein
VVLFSSIFFSFSFSVNKKFFATKFSISSLPTGHLVFHIIHYILHTGKSGEEI